MGLAKEYIMWLFVGALLVLIVTHASDFATAITAVGGQVNNSATILTGNTPTPAKKGK